MENYPMPNDDLEKIARRLFAFVFIALLILMVLITFGCGSKKKQIEKTEFSTEIATVQRVNALQEREVKTAVSVSETSKKTNVSAHENFQGEIADPSKEASVTVENHEGRKVYRYTNFKTVGSTNQISESETNKNFGQNVSRIDKSKTTTEAEDQIKGKASGSERNVAVAIARGFPWWILIVVVIIYGIISYFRGMNPLNWLKR